MAARIVILDIETTSLEADAGTLVSAGLMSDVGRGEYLEAKRTSDEKPLLLKLVKRLERYDVMVTWNGRSFDIPFLYVRALEGDRKATASIREHCLDDLRATRQVFLKLRPLVEQQLEYAEGHV